MHFQSFHKNMKLWNLIDFFWYFLQLLWSRAKNSFLQGEGHKKENQNGGGIVFPISQYRMELIWMAYEGPVRGGDHIQAFEGLPPPISAPACGH